MQPLNADVTTWRFQAQLLGEVLDQFTVRTGIIAAIAAVLIGSGPVQLPFILGSVGVALAAHVVYQRRMPPSI